MHFWIGVENFAKIERAKVCTNSYTLLVGPNNCGKTYFMQLVQGLSDKIGNLIEEDIINAVFLQSGKNDHKYILNDENINFFIEYLNAKLEKNKERLIKNIFGRDIPIGKLYIDIRLEKNTYYEIDILEKNELEKININEFGNIENHFPQIFKSLSAVESDVTMGILLKQEKQKKKPDIKMISVYMQQIALSDLLKEMISVIIKSKSLFLPSSRTGLLLLYRDFFANRTDDVISFRVENNGMLEKRESYGGLTEPIYEFLRFLQTYTEDEMRYKVYKNEMKFFENHLIEGHISVNKQGAFSYNSKDNETMVPMYLASAMINEIAPIELALTSDKNYERLIIDEVEASLHPQKQLELVRFLNRLNNQGVQLIMSTHSDTFVSKVNNLYILSKYIEKTNNMEMIDNFDLQKEDLINTEDLYVYEFVIQSNGRSVVQEITPNEKSGYQFDLFTKSAGLLYEEALRLGEMY